MDDRVQHLADKAKFNLPNETLYGFQRGVRVRDAKEADPCEAYIGKDLEIARAAHLVEDDEVRADEEDDLRGFLQIAFQWRVLRDAVGQLEVAWRFHRLHHRAHVAVEVTCDGLGQRGLS